MLIWKMEKDREFSLDLYIVLDCFFLCLEYICVLLLNVDLI